MRKTSPPSTTFALRLQPGDDLRRTLEAAVKARGATAAFVLAGSGSLRPALWPEASTEPPTQTDEDLELLTLTGSIAAQGAHLHMSVTAANGPVRGGPVAYGCTVRTSAEVLVALLPGCHFARDFTRQADARIGLDEAVVDEQAG